MAESRFEDDCAFVAVDHGALAGTSRFALAACLRSRSAWEEIVFLEKSR
ncbi:hypothetical protein trd_0734 [Thermomicrobium roseum DSM 5159]|uniref:Uncharacterized protein n=1 Tax=Thermomicrobium roseum (strain ATCC 27502 / DSM 5159 / P-2) TaxID=309801 RepID=B9KZ22_THERP|nr:hypothetical protein trd_0734 [Thermomicrobium roseum DSM 5159]